MTAAIPGGPAPLREDVVLSAEWLTAVLGARWPGSVVSGVEVVERLETVATKVRFRVAFDGDPHGAPQALCAKGYFNPATHAMIGATVTETNFYETVAASLPVRTPPCVHAAIDPDTGHGLVLMEDLKVAGATFLDPLINYGADEAATTLDQLAALHAATYQAGPGQRTGPTAAPAFAPRTTRLVQVMSEDLLQGLLDDGRAPGVGDDIRRADRLRNSVLELAKLGADGEFLVHGDVHTGNVYRYADGDPGIIDWQTAQRGLWSIDVAYHVGAVLDPDVRAASERALLGEYIGRLAAHGGPTLDVEDAWLLYRKHLAHGYFMWGITRRVVRPVIEALTDRLSRAVADHDSFGLLGV